MKKEKEVKNKKKKVKKPKKVKTCDQCCNCQYIGEGDFVCMLNEPVIVMEDFCPNAEYMYCGGADYEE